MCKMPSNAASIVSVRSQETNEKRTRERQQSSLHAQYHSDSRIGPACGNFARLGEDESCRVCWCSSPKNCSDDNIGNQMACTSNELNPFQGASCINICQNRNDHEGDRNEVDVPAFGDVMGMEQGGDAKDL